MASPSTPDSSGPEEIDVTASLDDLRRETGRQLEHWRLAAVRLGNLDAVAPTSAWRGLEHYLGVSLREALREIVARLIRTADNIARRLAHAGSPETLAEVRGALLAFRTAYTRAETSVDFFEDALTTRGAPEMGALLRACDHIATRSMAEVLTPLGRQVPAALTYLDAGLGASVLKAGLRLWDGTAENPVAAIKVTRHNLLRPTSLIHEAGHQVAHMLGWNDELRVALLSASSDRRTGEIYASWATEIAADAFAFVHTGYASVAALHDVIDGPDDGVFQYLPTDPHPVSYLRLLLTLEWCRLSFGDEGPWNAMVTTWTAHHPLERAPEVLRELLAACIAALPQMAAVVLRGQYGAFRGGTLTSVVDPQRVSPAALAQLERSLGAAANTSPYWIWNESIRLLALNGYQAAKDATGLRAAALTQEQWMLRLGGLRQAA
jgi:hypothetical protein